jgi:hypothetical protein
MFSSIRRGRKPRSRARLAVEALEQRSMLTSMFADFNGDGYDDLAIGAYGANDYGLADVGAVHVLYGSAAGLDADRLQVWTQDSVDVVDEVEERDLFGYSLAGGDFNGDGYDDLAIGAPGESLLGGGPGDFFSPVGVVYVLFGSTEGLTGSNSQFWSQDSEGIADRAEVGDRFGEVLGAGDFNGDRIADLAIGVPFEDFGAGAVHVLHGSSLGLTAEGSQFWSEDSPGIASDPDDAERFGSSLAAGDFNNDSRNDLAIGAPGATDTAGGGAVHVLYSAISGGLSAASSQYWTQDNPGIADTSEVGDEFGFSLAAGDFNGDKRADLAIGVPYEDLGGGSSAIVDAGAVHVLYGTTSVGLSSASSQFWTQDRYGIADSCEADDQFGFALAAGDFNRDKRADLAIGVPFEDLSVGGAVILNTGAVQVLYGSLGGLSAAFNQFWTQDSVGIADSSEGFERFGSQLTVGDFNGDGRADLVISAPFESVTDPENGVVHVLYGTSRRLSATASQLWSQEILGLFGDLGDQFGSGL